jgi:hypothetical protein
MSIVILAILSIYDGSVLRSQIQTVRINTEEKGT